MHVIASYCEGFQRRYWMFWAQDFRSSINRGAHLVFETLMNSAPTLLCSQPF